MMPSLAFQIWDVERRKRLDEIARAHRAVGGIKRGRRFATNQINQAYAMLLSAEFQGYCRDLHSECVDSLINTMSAGTLRILVRDALHMNRKLDVHNPNSGNLGSDFHRFGILLWDEIRNQSPRNTARQSDLENLNLWRNAIAHQDFTRVGGSMSLHLATVRKWRRTCEDLAISFDTVLKDYLTGLIGMAPWT
jgi:hypothetical protein